MGCSAISTDRIHIQWCKIQITHFIKRTKFQLLKTVPLLKTSYRIENNTISTFLFAVLVCMKISKRNCFIYWNFSSSRYICFMFVCFCPYIILSLLLLCLCVFVCVWLAGAPTYFTVNYILSNYLCKSFNFYKRVLATQKSRLVLRQLLLLLLLLVMLLLLFEGEITLKAPTWSGKHRAGVDIMHSSSHEAWLGQRPFITLTEAEPEAVAEVC